jgi:hypothetical protein
MLKPSTSGRWCAEVPLRRILRSALSAAGGRCLGRAGVLATHMARALIRFLPDGAALA